MPVTDANDKFRAKLAIFYNSDVAASEQIADYVCAEYGIPSANAYGIAMGVDPDTWAYSSGRLAVLQGAADHLDAISARGILLCEGSPSRANIARWSDPSNTSGYGIDTVRLVAMTKRLKLRAWEFGEPRLQENVNGGGNLLYPPASGAWTTNLLDHALLMGVQRQSRPPYNGDNLLWGGDYYDEYAGRFTYALDAGFEVVTGAYAGVSEEHRHWNKFASHWDGDFSRFSLLPFGRIGFPRIRNSGAYDANLYNKSVAIIRRGVWMDKPDPAGAIRAHFQVASVGGVNTPFSIGKQVYCWQQLSDAGYSQTSLWYAPGSECSTHTPATTMYPYANGLQSASDWTTENLDANTASPLTFDVGFGGGFHNDKSAWRATIQPADTGCIIMGGASYLAHQWVQDIANDDKLCAAYANPYTLGQGRHHSGTDMGSTADVFFAMTHGLSLLEASALGREDAHYPYGNPLVTVF